METETMPKAATSILENNGRVDKSGRPNFWKEMDVDGAPSRVFDKEAYLAWEKDNVPLHRRIFRKVINNKIRQRMLYNRVVKIKNRMQKNIVNGEENVETE